MYLLLFASAIRLKHKYPKVKRTYEVPGGKLGMWIVSGVGLLGSAFAIFVGFFPPKQLAFKHPEFFVGFLGAGVIISLLLPQLIHGMRKASWKRKAKEVNNAK
jgi:hypothetical protein